MRQPFACGLRVGTDILACNRILNPAKPDLTRVVRLANRFLHQEELRDLNQRFSFWEAGTLQHSSLKDLSRLSNWLAGRWAAKEAAKKAWNASLIGFKDVRVETNPTGDVLVVCDLGFEHETKITQQTAQLSISHDQGYAVAVVLATPLHSDLIAELNRRKSEAELKIQPVQYESNWL